MTSAIDVTKPISGNATTESVRQNFAVAASEISALQAALAAITTGSTWRNGTTAPANSLGLNGDYYLNTASFDVYYKASGAYTVLCNLKGAQGIQGVQGNTGAAGRGISSLVKTAGTGAAGTTDTYTITFTDTTTTTFSVVNGANGTGGGGSVTAPAYSADITASRAIATADLSSNAAPVLLIYNSASNGVLTIPNDATLGLTASSNAEIAVYQKGTGRVDVAAGSGVTINNYAGAPTSTQYVTQRFHRVGANTWSMQ